MKNLKQMMMASIAVPAMALSGAAMAEDVTIGFLGGFTGPAESLMPPIVGAVEILVDEVNANGGILGGSLTLATADAGCDAAKAGPAADRLVNTDNVTAMVGGICSSETISGATVAGIPGKAVMISPSSTAPTITDLEDDDVVFRVTPSDAFQGIELAKIILDKGIDSVALTHVNDDYGKGFADAFEAAYTSMGGEVASRTSHEEGKADYRAELGTMAGSADTLVILAFVSGSGQTILRQAIEAGDFTSYVGGDGMVGDNITEGVDAAAIEGMIATRPGTPELPGTALYTDLATAAGADASATFAPQAYDAAMILALAIQQKGDGSREGMSEAVRSVSSAPGEVILPGEWAKALEILSNGGEVNYEGASGSHEFDENGDVPGVIEELVVKAGKFVPASM